MVTKYNFMIGDVVRFTYNGKGRIGMVCRIENTYVTLEILVAGQPGYKSFSYHKIVGLKTEVMA